MDTVSVEFTPTDLNGGVDPWPNKQKQLTTLVAYQYNTSSAIEYRMFVRMDGETSGFLDISVCLVASPSRLTFPFVICHPHFEYFLPKHC